MPAGLYVEAVRCGSQLPVVTRPLPLEAECMDHVTGKRRMASATINRESKISRQSPAGAPSAVPESLHIAWPASILFAPFATIPPSSG